MAKITAPLFGFGAGGTLAKSLVFSKWRGRAYVRRHVIPANPNTVEQAKTRTVFSVANAIWKLMGTKAISPWDLFAKGQVLVGRNAFVGRYVAQVRGEVDQALMTFSPGAKGGLIASSLVLTPTSQGMDLTVTAPTPPDGWTLTGVIGAAILNGDPASQTDFRVFEGEDLSSPFTVVLTGLDGLAAYHCGAWLQWAKPDGSVAYGPSLEDQDTTLA